MKQKIIVEYLNEIPDKRRGAGQRHDQTFVLLIVLMATMSGYRGYRSMGDFVERNKKDLLMHFKPKKGRLPSFDTIRRVVQNMDFDELSKQFHKWSLQYVNLKESEWISIDGKAIAGTMTDYHDNKQRFIYLVSLYCSRQKLVIGNAFVDNAKESEIPAVVKLIEALDMKGVTFTLDALHCQKKL